MRQAVHWVLATLLIAGCANSAPEAPSTTDSGDRDVPSESSVAPLNSESSKSDDPDIEASSSDGVALASLVGDTTIVPGERFGPVQMNTTRQDLVDQFGEDRLVDEDFHVGEGFTEPATRIDLGEEYSFTVIWADESRTTPLEIRGLGNAWELPEGIRVGMPFADVEAALGDFKLFGLGWDYGGTVVLDDTTLDEYANSLVLRLQPGAEAIASANSDFESVLGDQVYDSSNPHFQALDMTVDQIIVMLTPPAE